MWQLKRKGRWNSLKKEIWRCPSYSMWRISMNITLSSSYIQTITQGWVFFEDRGIDTENQGRLSTTTSSAINSCLTVYQQQQNQLSTSASWESYRHGQSAVNRPERINVSNSEQDLIFKYELNSDLFYFFCLIRFPT